MLILSNALTNVVDEGCVKVAYNLVKRLKNVDDGTVVIAFDRQSDLADEYMSVNKLLLSRRLFSRIRKHRGAVVYIPFPAKSFSTAVRIFILSLFAGKNFRVMLSMTSDVDSPSKLLLKMSRAKITVFSKRSYELYSSIVGEKRVTYLKAAVDTEKFVPAAPEKVAQLKVQFGFDVNKKVVLHVGHLNRGRNVEQLEKLTDKYQALLVTSTQTKDEQDAELRKELLSCGVRIIDSYVPDIERIYQMSDVYLFPVVEQGRCIDVPLSCMEAAACNKPIVTTDFGEMREFVGRDGFCFISSFEEGALCSEIDKALEMKNISTRSAVMGYDWQKATSVLTD